MITDMLSLIWNLRLFSLNMSEYQNSASHLKSSLEVKVFCESQTKSIFVDKDQNCEQLREVAFANFIKNNFTNVNSFIKFPIIDRQTRKFHFTAKKIASLGETLCTSLPVNFLKINHNNWNH